jgi:hypothetical protein
MNREWPKRKGHWGVRHRQTADGEPHDEHENSRRQHMLHVAVPAALLFSFLQSKGSKGKIKAAW